MAWGKAEFDQFYGPFSVEREFGFTGRQAPIRLNYHWWPILRWQRSYAPRVMAPLGITAGMRVCLIGCGFNGTGAGLTDQGVEVIGAELSTYIQQNKGTTEEADIRAACIAAGVDPDTDLINGPAGPFTINPLDYLMEGGRASPQPRGKGTILAEELRTRGSRNSVIGQFTGNVNFILTEEVLNSITDNEAGLLCDYCTSAANEWGGSTVVHLLSPRQPRKAGAQLSGLNWKTYAEWRAWLDANGYASHLILPTVTAWEQGMHFPDQATFVSDMLSKLLGMGRAFEEANPKAIAWGIQCVDEERVEAFRGTF